MIAMRTAPSQLDVSDLHAALRDPSLQSMNFLNEIADRHPEAISFAPGRPYEEFFDVEAIPRYLTRFLSYSADVKGLGPLAVRRQLFQYGRTKGIIHDLIARNLAVDEGIEVDPEAVVVTVGCQEAMLVALCALRANHRDVVLAVEPTYVGLCGAAALLDIPVLPVRDDPDGIDLDHLTTQLAAARAAGTRPRALYVVPDFANPSGTTMPLEIRHRLLDIAEAHDILVLEDNPYRLFGDSDQRLPTLKALSRAARVVYLGSLSKSCFPGVRIGYVVADQRVSDPAGGSTLLADELAKVKSMVTLNTSPLAQAIAGGMLLENDCSLVAGNQREIEVYRRNRSLLLSSLERDLAACADAGVSWNSPTGGFFVVLRVPFAANSAALEYSAQKHGVLWTPMQDFYQGRGGEDQLRLSCSTLDPDGISEGTARLASFVADGIATGGWRRR
jgi:(S)-3,5-dihydroxyphenylglycine transaminase